ncbi:hypothetical protein AN642_02010 [Epulopiscium sp. SCG-B10WGA-EpuloA2]|nr:hypothetical protein AN642_02010 [Epulopiscium sp. SCG-B10WGA-EpuloA2]
MIIIEKEIKIEEIAIEISEEGGTELYEISKGHGEVVIGPAQEYAKGLKSKTIYDENRKKAGVWKYGVSDGYVISEFTASSRYEGHASVENCDGLECGGWQDAGVTSKAKLPACDWFVDKAFYNYR